MKKRKNQLAISTSFIDFVFFSALVVVLLIIPLIVRVYRRGPTDDELLIRTSNDIWDSFSYYKSFWITAVGAVIGFTALSGFVVGEYKFEMKMLKNPVTIAACVYIAFVILSAVFSPYRQTALSGIAERYESVYVLLSYIAVFFAAVSFVKDESRAKIFFYLFLISAFLIGTVGAFQTFGFDIFRSEFGKKLVMGEMYNQGYRLNVEYTKTYSTLYNPNCVGLYSAFLTPVFFFTGIFTEKKNPLKYICLLLSVLMVICLYGSGSVAGYIGFIASAGISVIIFLVYMAKFSKRKVLFFACASAAFAVCLVAVFLNFSKIKGLVVWNFNLDGSKTNLFLRDMEIEDNTATITTERGKVLLKALNGEFLLLNEGGEEIKPVSAPEAEGFTQMMYSIEGIGAAEIRYASSIAYLSLNGIQFFFRQTENGGITPTKYPPEYEEININEKIPSIGFDGLEHMASGRGLIWSRSLPLALQNIIIGAGPDSFAYVFPQHDIIGKIRGLGSPYTIVDKPHNTFLQIAVNTGFISLLALGVIFGYYMFTSLKGLLSQKRKDGFFFGVSLGFCAGIFAYLVCSLSTDSTVSVSPVFYAGLGFALALNKLRKYA
ncbi:MAG: O-antigen ligase family protein [Clostridiales bacterium]|jgi:hypothetical protein|nr:O-antigen ligase family protein [Clostridiales bacterium]